MNLTAEPSDLRWKRRSGPRWLPVEDEESIVGVLRWYAARVGFSSTMGAQLDRLFAKSPPEGLCCPTCGAGIDGHDATRCHNGHMVDHWVARETWKEAYRFACPSCGREEAAAHGDRERSMTCALGHASPFGSWERRPVTPAKMKETVASGCDFEPDELEDRALATAIRRLNRMSPMGRWVLSRVYGLDGCYDHDGKPYPARGGEFNHRYPWSAFLGLAPLAKHTPWVRDMAKIEASERRQVAYRRVCEFWDKQLSELPLQEGELAVRARMTGKQCDINAWTECVSKIEQAKTAASVRCHPSQFPLPPLDLERALGVAMKDRLAVLAIDQQLRAMMAATVTEWEGTR